jgi:protein TIF31
MEASGLFDVGQVRLQSGNIKGGHEYLMEAVKFFTQVYGPLHVDIANCYRVLARVQHALGDTSMAIQYQYKSVLIYERLFGIDHSSTITAYFHLAQYCCIAGKNDTSALLLYHTRYLILLIHGTDHPELANVDFYIGLILSNSGHFTKGVEFLESALKLQKKFVVICLCLHRVVFV